MAWGGMHGTGGWDPNARAPGDPGRFATPPPGPPARPSPWLWFLLLILPAVLCVALGVVAVNYWTTGSIPGAASTPGAATPDRWLGEPRLVAGRLFATASDHVVAFDAEGRRTWQSRRCPEAAWASPIASETAELVVVVCAGLYTALDPVDGHVVSRYPRPNDVDQTRIGGRTLVVNAPGSFVAVDLRTGLKRWEKRDLVEPAASVDATTVYAGTPTRVQAFDSVTGAEKWSVGDAASDLWAAAGAVVVRTRVPRHLLRLDAATGTELWASAVDPEPLDTSFLLGANDRIAILGRKAHDRVIAYAFTRPDLAFTIDLPPGAEGFAVLGDHVVVVTDDTNRSVVAYDQGAGIALDPPGVMRGGRAASSGRMIAVIPTSGADHLDLHALP